MRRTAVHVPRTDWTRRSASDSSWAGEPATRSRSCRSSLGFALGEWFVLTGAGSFADSTSFLGVIVVSLLGGFLPVLLFASSRGKGECAFGTRRGVLRHPALLTSIYLFFLAMLFAHGLVIWDEPMSRESARSRPEWRCSCSLPSLPAPERSDAA